VASEDVAYLLARSGIETGLDLDKLIEATHWLGTVMGKEMPSMLARAGGFLEAVQA
jgi:hydroxymethylglutaryl-CoA lyase